jgi:hypothetical protein
MAPARPMPVAAAQRTRVRKCTGFLSRSEVRLLVRRLRALDLQPYTSCAADVAADGAPIHTTTYVQTGGLFARRFPRLRRRIIALAADACAREGWGWDLRTVGRVRCAEYHEYRPGAALEEEDHHDEGSLASEATARRARRARAAHAPPASSLTRHAPSPRARAAAVDILLEEAERGGAFQTVEPGGGPRTHAFRAGDALVFCASKYHRVSRVEAGRRRVLIVELWSGEERHCGHRCPCPEGECRFVDEGES